VSGKRKQLSFIAAGAAALVILACPAQAQLFGGDEAARKQIAEQAKRIEDLRQQNDALSGRLTRIEESIKSLSASNPALELAGNLDTLRQELKQMRGQIEVLGNDVQMAGKRQRDMYVDLDARMKRLEQPPATAEAAPASPAPAAASAAGAAAAGGTQPAPAPSPPAPPASDAETRVYEAAQNQRKIGNYQGAIAAFRNFIAQYPRSPLAHRAQYWIGDSYYNLRDFKGAIASQQRLISSYPNSASVPDALLNIASSQLELGDTAGARKTLDKLVARYPASEAAEKARRRLSAPK
jgi:tol-pal system protein YbgF